MASTPDKDLKSLFSGLTSEDCDSRTIPGWWPDLQKQAWTDFEKLGFPGRKNESWQYTSLTAPSEWNFRAAPEKLSDAEIREMKQYFWDDALNLVLVNGHLVTDPEIELPEGLQVSPVSEVMTGHSEIIAEMFEMFPSQGEDGLTALNTALLRGGLVLQVSPGRAVEKPVHIIHVQKNERAKEGATLASPTHFIRAGEGASVSIYEEYCHLKAGQDLPRFNNGLCNVHLEKNSRVKLRLIQRSGPNTFSTVRTRVRQDHGSCFDSFSLAAGGRLSRHSQLVYQAETGSYSRLHGLFLARGHEQCEQHTEIRHQCPGGESDQLIKGVLHDKGTGVFVGKVLVAQDAQKTRAGQLSKSLLCSPDARAFAKPQLEIDADDVRCSHGSTVSQIRDDEIFYCQSRGMDRQEARSLLSLAFAEEVLHRCDDPLVTKYVRPGLLTHSRSADSEEE